MSTDVATLTQSSGAEPALYVSATPQEHVKETPVLFQPLKVGAVTLSHRVAMAPLTRNRADDNHIPTDLQTTYYSQRASSPGTLIISEATFISPQAGGYGNVPGIYNEEQIKGWKKVTDAIHANKSFFFLQLWALGRAAHPDVLEREGPYPYVSSSNVRQQGRSIDPRPLTKDEIAEYTEWYAQAAENAIKAGADGVEIHGANGYLIDQFIQDVTNTRTDEYGGSIENRSRFALEVIDAVVKRVGAERTGLRLSPWNTFQGMREKNPVPTFSYLIGQIKDRFPDLAYMHNTAADPTPFDDPENPPNHDFARNIWRRDGKGVFLTTDGYERDTALQVAKEKGDVIVFGKYFIANPDLPRRLKGNIPLTPWDASTFYSPKDPHGYIDYPFAEEKAQSDSARL